MDNPNHTLRPMSKEPVSPSQTARDIYYIISSYWKEEETQLGDISRQRVAEYHKQKNST